MCVQCIYDQDFHETHARFRGSNNLLSLSNKWNPISNLSGRNSRFVVQLFLTVPWVGLQFKIVVFPDHTHLHFGLGKTEDEPNTVQTYGMANMKNKVIKIRFPFIKLRTSHDVHRPKTSLINYWQFG